MRFLRWLLLPVVFGACTDLPELRSGVCGNGVVEAGEDCDTFAPAGLACRAPGANDACRFACGPGGGACPIGWGCGQDGLCREPTTTFEPTSAVVLASASDLLVGDLDGDLRADVLTLGRPDVFGRREARVHYFDADGGGARTLVLPPQVVGPRLADVDGDGLSDLIAGTGIFAGVAVFLGTREQTLAPVAYPSFTLPEGNRIHAIVQDLIPTRANGDFLGAEVLLLATFKDVSSQQTVNLLAPNGGPESNTLLWLEKGPEALADDVKFGQFNTQTPCADLVFGFQGEQRVLVFSPCIEKAGVLGYNNSPDFGLPPQLPPTEIALPAPLTGPIFPVDFDGDGLLDVLIGVEGKQAVVAYGDGQQGFHAKPFGGASNAASPVDVPRGYKLDSGLGLPIAVGDLNLDKRPDFVMERGVFVSLFQTQDGLETLGGLPKNTIQECGKTQDGDRDCPVAINFGSPWRESLIGDLNRDGIPDLVAGSGEAGLEYFQGTPLGLLNRFSYPTSGAAGRFAIGDFDGDFLPDLAFREQGIHGQAAGGDPVGDALSVLFGRLAAPPELPVSMGRFERIEQVTAASYFTDKLTTSTALDVGLISSSEDQKEQRVSVLAGSGDRQLLAPFGFQVVQADQNGTTLAGAVIALAPADLDGDGTMDLAALAFDSGDRQLEAPSSFRLWLARGTGDGGFIEPHYSEPLDYLKPLPQNTSDEIEIRSRLRALLTAGDLDGDGKAEVIQVVPDASGGNSSLLFIAHAENDAENKPHLVVSSSTPLSFYVPTTGQLMLADLDGDQRPELLMLAASAPPSLAEGAAPTDRVVVLWNSGQGSFDPQGALVLTHPDAGLALRGFAAITRGNGKDLVLATNQETRIARRTERTFALTEQKLPRATSLAAADVTGDGLEDLALLDSDTVRLLVGVPARR